MYKELKSIFKSSLLYSLSGIMAKVMGLILIPFFTNVLYLSQEEYGVMGLMEALLVLSPTIIIFGINIGFSRFYWDKDYVGKKKSLMFNNLLLTIVSSSFFFLLVYTFRDNLSRFLFTSTDYSNILLIGVIIAFFIITNGFMTELLKLNEKSKKLTAINFIYYTSLLCLTILFMVVLKKGLLGVYIAQLLALIVQFIFYIPLFIKHTEIKFDKLIIKDLLIYSLPIAAASLSSVMFSLADKYTLRFMSDLPDVGYYTLGFRLSNTFKIIISVSILSALIPVLYKTMKTKEGYKMHERSFKYISILGACLALSFILLRTEIVRIFAHDPSYLVSSIIIPFVVCGLYISMLKDIIIVGLNIEKKTKFIGFSTFIMAFVNIALNILCVYLFSILKLELILGTAFATFLINIIYLLWVYFYSRKFYPVRYKIGSMFLILFLMILFVLLGEVGGYFSFLGAFAYRLFLIILFPFSLYLFNVISNKEKQGMLDIFGDIKRKIS